jgi:hypothetical protein
VNALLHARRFDELDEACADICAAWRGAPTLGLTGWIERALALRECFAVRNVVGGLERLGKLTATLPLCEPQVVASIEAAWICLEQGEVAAARRGVEHLTPWLHHTPLGMQVQARLHYLDGDWNAAVQAQATMIRESNGTSTSFQRLLLALYLRAATDQRPQEIPPLDEGLGVHWHVEIHVLDDIARGLDVKLQDILDPPAV